MGRFVNQLPIEVDALVLLAEEGEERVVKFDVAFHPREDAVVAAHALVDGLIAEDVVLFPVGHVEPAGGERAEDVG